MDFKSVREIFGRRGKESEFSEYEACYNALIKRIEHSCKGQPQGDWGDPKRIRQYALVLRQVLLHRGLKLFLGSLHALLENNPYSMILSIRGHFETTAALGYLHNRLNSLHQGNLDAHVVDRDICTQLLGSRDERLLASMGEDVLKAEQVLNMLEYADRSISKNILGGKAKEHDILTDCYKFLCEFSHPNFHSNTVAFELDKEAQEFKIRHYDPMRDSEFDIIDYLLLSAPIFLALFDKIEEVLPKDECSNKALKRGAAKSRRAL
jgi:hypothetical protein